MENPKITLNNPTLLAIILFVIAIVVFITLRIFLYSGSANEKGLSAIGGNNAQSGIRNASDSAGKSGKKSIYLPVLMYHHVGPLPENADDLRKDLTISTEDFEMQAAWLKGQGFESTNFDDLLQYAKGQKKLPDKPVIFSFDDGYEDAFINAVPTLQEFGFAGSFGIITQFPGIKVGDNIYATWEQIAKAKTAGMEIISHTQDHFDGTNPKYDDNFILRNLTGSKQDIKDHLGASVPVLTYPFGRFDGRYVKLARQAGFEMGITTQEGQIIFLDNFMEIPRIRVHGRESLEIFKKLFQR